MKNTSQYNFSFPKELIIDNFAGGGGTSEGIEQAFGRCVSYAINHDAEALAMHCANHPETVHLCESVFKVNPIELAAGRQVGLAWFSPDCKHFSKAKGGKPVSKRIRGLAWVAVRWAATVKPRLICLENVEEFKQWGPLLQINGEWKPDPKRKGITFQNFCSALRRHGYKLEHRELRACDYGTPTIRKRLFLIARCDGLPIVWPKPTHGKGLRPYARAADCIDWSIPCPSIFDRKRPLAEATLRRIAKGIDRFVIKNADPFIVPVTHVGDDRSHSIQEPMRTITSAARGEFAVISPTLVNVANGKTTGRAPNTWPIEEPVRTVTASNGFGVVAATMIAAAHGEGKPGGPQRWGEGCSDIHDPTKTVTASGGGGAAVVAAFLAQHNSDSGGDVRAGRSAEEPLSTIVHRGTQQGVVSAFLAQHNTERNGGVKAGRTAEEPFSTVTGSGSHQQVVTAVMSQQYTSNTNGGEGDLTKPVRTVTAEGTHQGLVTALLDRQFGNSAGASVEEPLGTVTGGGGGKAALVKAFLIKFYSQGGQWQSVKDPMHTVPTVARLGLVTIKGIDYQIVDIGMRMLTPRELARAQGFPDRYILDPMHNGKPLNKTAQIRMIGNSVCPQVARAIVETNLGALIAAEAAA